MQRDFLGASHGLAFHFVHDICTTEALAIQGFRRRANLLSAAQFFFLGVAVGHLQRDGGTPQWRR